MIAFTAVRDISGTYPVVVGNLSETFKVIVTSETQVTGQNGAVLDEEVMNPAPQRDPETLDDEFDNASVIIAWWIWLLIGIGVIFLIASIIWLVRIRTTRSPAK
jgi:hypothetical protein